MEGSFYGRGLHRTNYSQNSMHHGSNCGGNEYSDPRLQSSHYSDGRLRPGYTDTPSCNQVRKVIYVVISQFYYQGAIGHRLDQVVTLILEQKTVSEDIKKETSALRKEIDSLKSEVSLVKEDLKQKTSPSCSADSSSGSVRKKIPSQLSVSLHIELWVLRVGVCVCLCVWRHSRVCGQVVGECMLSVGMYQAIVCVCVCIVYYLYI